MLGIDIDHEDCVRNPVEIPYAAEVRLELGELSPQTQPLLLGAGVHLAGGLHVFQLAHVVDPLLDRLEVREHAAQPPVVDVGHVRPLRRIRDRRLGLLLGTDEHDQAPLGSEILGVGSCGVDLI